MVVLSSSSSPSSLGTSGTSVDDVRYEVRRALEREAVIRLSGAVMRVDTMALDDDDVFWGRGPTLKTVVMVRVMTRPALVAVVSGASSVASPVSVASAESVVSSPSSLLLSSGCWPPPEMHCEYQSLPKLQILPVAQAVGPFQLRPPPGVR